MKKTDLERSFHWLSQVLGIGPGLGDVFFVAASGGAYESWLKYCGVGGDHLFTTVAAAYAAATTDRNDVICKEPGLETVTAGITWAKNRTHLVGLGGPQQKGLESGTGLYTVTGTVAALITNTGINNQFHNITLGNAGPAATALTAFRNTGYGTRLINSQFIGMMGATACDTTLASSLEIGTGGYYFYAENCQIGSTDFGLQGSDTNAPLVFTGGGQPSDGRFYRCNFSTYIAAATRPLIYVAAQSVDRDWVFDQCEFYAFSVNHAVAANQVISNQCGHSHDFLFKYCSTINVTAIQTTASAYVWAIGGRETDHLMGVSYPSAAA